MTLVEQAYQCPKCKQIQIITEVWAKDLSYQTKYDFRCRRYDFPSHKYCDEVMTKIE